MCGICGVVGLKSDEPANHEIIEAMCASMTHRGPDDQGVYCQGNVGLGMRRLSIIDLVTGQQPMTNEERSVWVVFNGEIYNFLELRQYLEKRNHRFISSSDTEVLVHLYEEFGEAFVDLLDGIFAFAIWDAKAQKILLARDRMGIKPLYYTEVDGKLIFGSEMKVLLAHPLVERDVDLASLNEYLSFEYVPTPKTILKNIKRLSPGHYMIGGRQGLKIEEYWRLSLEYSERRPAVDERDYIERLRDLLNETVKRELVSDVPVGVFLSGGIDSTSITAFMVRNYPGEVNSFSIGFADKSFDETDYARLASRTLGTRHHEMVVTDEMASGLVPDIYDYLDEPFGDSSFIPTFLVSKLARQQLKVVLGGDGGDELFAGYPTLVARRLLDIYSWTVPWIFRATLVPWLVKRLPVSFSNISFDFKLRRFLASQGYPVAVGHQRWLGSFFDEEKASLLQDWVKPVLRDTYAPALQLVGRTETTDLINKLMHLDMKLYLEGDILYKVDRASMANSLEVRVPFLNKEMVEFANQIPVELKLRGLKSKYILKKAMKPYLPNAIIRRSKKGFNMPVARWINGELRQLVNDMLSPNMLKMHGYFNDDYVRLLLEEHAAHRADHRKLIWTLLMFQLWYDRWM